MRVHRHLLVGSFCLLNILSLACRRQNDPAQVSVEALQAAPRAPATSEHAPGADRPEPYPEGRWQHIAPADLEQTVLWVSHVLIRHEEVEQYETVFNLTEWHIPQARATRSRREALLLANRIAQQAREQGHFADLAREFSEDPVTQAAGGSLGGISAGQISTFSEVLDALFTLKVGDVSRPVETVWGYHVFYRRPPPPEQTVTGQRIVIGHETAPWLRYSKRGPLQSRSRQDALALANQVFEQARRSPADFERLVQRYSEHRDALRNGDMGTWSTREPSPFPVELEVLSGLAIGQVAPPRDSLFGYQILRHVPDPPRQEFALGKIQVRFDESAPEGAAGSESTARARAARLLAEVQRDPSRFAALQAEYCCTDPLRVVEGRDGPEIEALLRGLVPGQIADRLVRNNSFEFIIAQRLEPSVLAPKPKAQLDFLVAGAR